MYKNIFSVSHLGRPQLPFVEGVRLAGSGPGTYLNENAGIRNQQRGEGDQVIQFAQHLAERAGNVDAMRHVGQLLYYGARGMRRDIPRAAQYFERAAARGDVSPIIRTLLLLLAHSCCGHVHHLVPRCIALHCTNSR